MIENGSEIQNYHLKPKTVTVGNIRGHDIRVSYLQKENPTLDLTTYDPDGPVLRAENGLGHLPEDKVIKLWEVLKAGRSGKDVDISPPDHHFPLENILSSQLYDFKEDDDGNITAKFLQYRLPYGEPQPPITHNLPSGRTHTGWTGKEVKALLEVHWINEAGIILEPTIIGGRSFAEEIAHAKEVLGDPEALETFNKPFRGLRKRLDTLLHPLEPIPLPVREEKIAA